jgi:Zn-dependent M28 family amino/carboxypeptidase
MWPFLPAPGADDDGSGSVTILEAYRALLAADFTRSSFYEADANKKLIDVKF